MEYIKKEYILICTVALLLSLLPGCGGREDNSDSAVCNCYFCRTGPGGVKSVLEARMVETYRLAETEETKPMTESAGPAVSGPAEMPVEFSAASPASGQPEKSVPSAEKQTTDPPVENAEIDLTHLSDTLVYPKVYEMTNVPQNYLGKTVKMSGSFAVYPNINAEKKYFTCVVADKAGCCQLGIEFDLCGEHVFPDDYPEIGGRITVIGRFDRYYEKYRPYFTLRDARLLEGLTLKEIKALENEVH